MKIICVARSYAKHAEELNNPVPHEPILFMKPPSALLVNDKPFYYPEFSQEINYELEVVIKICRNGRHVQAEFAHRYYEEVAIGLDMTARDVQSELKAKGYPWEIAKGFDGSAVISSFIPVSQLKDREAIDFHLTKNGEEVQRGNTSMLLFSFEDIIVKTSQYFKLQVGDYIYTGTPAGVGPVSRGDLLEGYLEGQHLLSCEIK